MAEATFVGLWALVLLFTALIIVGGFGTPLLIIRAALYRLKQIKINRRYKKAQQEMLERERDTALIKNAQVWANEL